MPENSAKKTRAQKRKEKRQKKKTVTMNTAPPSRKSSLSSRTSRASSARSQARRLPRRLKQQLRPFQQGVVGIGGGGANEKTKELAKLAWPLVDPFGTTPQRLCISDEPTACAKFVAGVSWTLGTLAPMGFPTLAPGNIPVFMYRDLLRPVVYPMINPPDKTKSSYTWMFKDEYGYTGATGVNAGEASYNAFFTLPVAPQSSMSNVDINRLISPIAATFTGTVAQKPHGALLFAAVPGTAGTSYNLSDGSFMFNGGELIEVSAMCDVTIPPNCGFNIVLSLVKYMGMGTEGIVLDDPAAQDPANPHEVTLTISSGTAARTASTVTLNSFPLASATAANTGVFAPATQQTSNNVGYLGIRIAALNIAYGGSNWDPRNLRFMVRQFFPTMAAIATNTTTGPVNDQAVFRNVLSTAAPNAVVRCYSKPVWVCPSFPDLQDGATLAAMTRFRVTASAVLLTNVSASNNLEGTVHAVSVSEQQDWSTFDVSTVQQLSLFGTTSCYAGELRKGNYNWFRPTTNTAFHETVKTGFAGYMQVPFPLIRLMDSNPMQVALLVDSDPTTATSMFVRWCTHVEYVPSSHAIFEPRRSCMTTELYEALRLALSNANEHTENWIHIDQLWAAIKRGAVSVVKAGLGAAAVTAVKELTAGLALLAV